jgi:hypothetical protein
MGTPLILSYHSRQITNTYYSQPTRQTNTSYAPFASSPLATASNTTIHQRQQNALNAQNIWLLKSAKLDTFMLILQDTCPACFATSGQLVKHIPFRECPTEMIVPSAGWIAFKRSFRFVPYTYCFTCGLPQDRGAIKESPDCHRCVSWGKGVICPWADYVFIVIWCIWHTPRLRSKLLTENGLSADITYDDFVEWAKEEDPLEGEYYKALEVFIRFCETWQASWQRVGNRRA